MTYMLLLNCALKLVEEIILYYDARSKKHQKCPIWIDVSENEYTCHLLAVQGSYFWFLGAFVKQCIQRIVTSSCMSVLLVVSDRTEELGPHWKYCHKILYWIFSQKSAFVKIRKKSQHTV